jgi:hypothetical protein
MNFYFHALHQLGYHYLLLVLTFASCIKRNVECQRLPNLNTTFKAAAALPTFENEILTGLQNTISLARIILRWQCAAYADS